MSDRAIRRPWRPTPVTMVAGALVLAGFLLADIDWGFFALAGLGALGPGLLRELGWLRDKDEFQLEAARRAGYHGFLAAGLVAFALTAYYRRQPDLAVHPGNPVELVLAVLWFTWLLSSLLAYWGPRRMAVRVLVIFGGVWLVFNVLSGWEQGPVGVLMQSLLAVPFLALAWAARRWPRAAGLLLLVCAGFFVWLFRLHEVVRDPFGMGRIFVIIFFIGPLATAGLGLLGRDPDTAGAGRQGGHPLT